MLHTQSPPTAAPTYISLALIALSLLWSPHANAAVVGYWRFEDDPGYLADSSGNGHTLIEVGTPAQLAIPGSGNGSDFPNPVEETGEPNFRMGSTNGRTGHWRTPNPFDVTDFTLEAFVSRPSGSGDPMYIMAHYEAGAGNRRFAFGIRGNSQGNNLFLLLSEDGSDQIFIDSPLSLAVNTDYYVAVSFDESDQESGVKFYVLDLTNGGDLLSSVHGHPIVSLHDPTSADFNIGALRANGTQRWPGFIDEVRVSNTVLAVHELLIPEPGAAALATLGLSLLAIRHRRGASARR